MFRLKMATDPRWVNIVEKNIHEILTDHAYCEQKAASNAISIVVKYPEHSDMVSALLDIAQEELSHFKMVHDKLLARNLTLGKERKDPYVNVLLDFVRKGGSREQNLVDRLLVSAMIEARSCERFRVLSENINDADLSQFYNELMISEANHYTVFINLARQYGDAADVETRWNQFLEYEGKIMQQFGVKETIHG